MLQENDFIHEIQANQGIIKKLVGLYADTEEDKKDLYQEILCQAWKGFGSFRGEAKFSTWLYRISLNTILTAKRKTNRIDFRETVDDLPHAIPHASQQSENKRLLQQAIRRLPETERALITLHLDGYTNPEIAEMMGVSANNATVKLHRIKNQLVNLLQPHLQ